MYSSIYKHREACKPKYCTSFRPIKVAVDSKQCVFHYLHVYSTAALTHLSPKELEQMLNMKYLSGFF